MTPPSRPDWRELRRQARRRIAVRATLTILVAIPAIVTISSLFIIPTDAHLHELAVSLQENGVTVVSDDVEVRSSGKATEARATYDVGAAGTVTGALRGASPVASGDNWTPATDGTGYDAPLEIVYSPTHPTVAMALRDVAHHAPDDVLREDMLVAAASTIPLLVTLGVWLARGRPAWWLYFDKIGEPCWYCAHPKENHDHTGQCAARTRRGACECDRYHWHRPSNSDLEV